MAELILIRHSISQPHPEQNSHEWLLTDEGRAKCKIVAEKLRPYPIRQIYTSAESKAVETGKIVAEILELPSAIATDLGETKREGLDLMANLGDFKAQVREAMRRPDEKLFGEETFSEARERFLKEMNGLLAKHPNETIALVSHGRVLSMVLAQFSGEDPVSIWDSLKMPAYAVVSLPEMKVLALVRDISEET
jgi:broad specificity phosphatase PhoE